MQKNIVITSGFKYLDIDAYAGCIVYREFVKSKGYQAKAITTAPYNQSVSALITDIDYAFDTLEDIEENSQFVILDVSNPTMLDTFVKEENIITIIDHHTGYEDYWEQKKNTHPHIEFIGSICTLIFEQIEQEEKLDILNPYLCQLMVAAILDNTLNLKATITTSRDIRAYHTLLKIGNLDASFADTYFLSCQNQIEKDLFTALKNDMKIASFGDILPSVFGQLLVWNHDNILTKVKEIESYFATYHKEWMLNIISLREGKSYILASSPNVQSHLEKLFQKSFQNNILILEPFMLRKEIIKQAQTDRK